MLLQAFTVPYKNYNCTIQLVNVYPVMEQLNKKQRGRPTVFPQSVLNFKEIFPC